jgi:hypothetical protein
MIVLLLMGGGLVLLSVRSTAECRQAQQDHRPDADLTCGRTGGHASGGGGGGSRASTAVTRGGFGDAGSEAAHS